MGTFSAIIGAAFCLFFMWMLYQHIKYKPEDFTLANMNKSMLTSGILAIILIGLIGFVIIMLRQT